MQKLNIRSARARQEDGQQAVANLEQDWGGTSTGMDLQCRTSAKSADGNFEMESLKHGASKSKLVSDHHIQSTSSGLFATHLASLVAQMVKRLPAMQETQVRSLGWEDPLEKEMKWQPTPVSLPGKSHGQRSLIG